MCDEEKKKRLISMKKKKAKIQNCSRLVVVYYKYADRIIWFTFTSLLLLKYS